MCLPGVELPLFDAWLPQVIQDKGCIRAATRQFNDIRQLPVFDTEIKRQFKLRQQAHSRDKIGPQAEIRLSFVLQVAPDSFNERRDGYQGSQVLADGLAALDRCRSNDRLQTWLLSGKIHDMACLTQRLLRLNPHLDIDHPYDGETLRLLAVVLQAIGPI